MIVTIHNEYRAGNSTNVELPEGRQWSDVENWYVKWGVLYVTFKDGEEFEHNMDDDIDIYTTKRPCSSIVYDEEGNELEGKR